MQPITSPCRPADDQLAPFRRLQSLAPSPLRNRLRNQLVEEHLGLVRQVACRLTENRQLRDELYSEGCLALLAAVDCFDPSRGFRFSTFATACIRNRLFRWLKREKRRGRFVPLDTLTTMSQAGLTPEEAVSAADEQIWMTQAVETLPERERKFVALRFGLGTCNTALSFREIGERVALSKERVRQIVAQSLERLKEEMA